MHSIGISLSGGGLRAAAFGMGCLAYLQHVRYRGRPLLHAVRYGSSTSGGSLALAYHAVRSHAGVPFTQALRDLRTAVGGTRLLDEAVRTLNDDAVWTTAYPHKTRNLINAFAVVYDRLLDHARLERLLDGPVAGAGPVITEHCFNSTELHTGRAFPVEGAGRVRRDRTNRATMGCAIPRMPWRGSARSAWAMWWRPRRVSRAGSSPWCSPMTWNPAVAC